MKTILDIKKYYLYIEFSILLYRKLKKGHDLTLGESWLNG